MSHRTASLLSSFLVACLALAMAGHLVSTRVVDVHDDATARTLA